MSDTPPTKEPDDDAQSSVGTLLNLVAVARMLHADDNVAPEEIELFEDLLEAGGLSEHDRAVAQAWAEAAPDEKTLADLAMVIDEDGRLEALALSWVTAHADGEIVQEELDEHDKLAELLGLPHESEATRQSVEDRFFGSALTVLASLAAMCRIADDPDDGRVLYDDAVEDMDLPTEIAQTASGWFEAPRALHDVLAEASALAPDFQEALLGHLGSLAGALGADETAKALFDRFDRACGVDDERVREIQAEWSSPEEETQ